MIHDLIPCQWCGKIKSEHVPTKTCYCEGAVKNCTMCKGSGKINAKLCPNTATSSYFTPKYVILNSIEYNHLVRQFASVIETLKNLQKLLND